MATTNFQLYKNYALRVLAEVKYLKETEDEFVGMFLYSHEIGLQAGIGEHKFGSPEFHTAKEALDPADQMALMLLFWMPVIEAWQEVMANTTPKL